MTDVLLILVALAVVALQIYLISVVTTMGRAVDSMRRDSDSMGAASSPTGRAPAAPSPLRTWGKDVSRLREADELRQSGILNDDEFALVKAEILAGWGPSQPSPDLEETPTEEPRFSVAIRDLSGADPNQVAQIVRRYANFESDSLQVLPLTLHVGVPLETGRLLIEDLAKAGVTAGVVTSQ